MHQKKAALTDYNHCNKVETETIKTQTQIWNSVLELGINCEPLKSHDIQKPAEIAHTETKYWVFKQKQIITCKAEVSVTFIPEILKHYFTNILIN